MLICDKKELLRWGNQWELTKESVWIEAFFQLSGKTGRQGRGVVKPRWSLVDCFSHDANYLRRGISNSSRESDTRSLQPCRDNNGGHLFSIDSLRPKEKGTCEDGDRGRQVTRESSPVYRNHCLLRVFRYSCTDILSVYIRG